MKIVRHHFSTIDSTNNWVKRNVEDFAIEALTLVTADEQTAGRGRLQRQWMSPANKNVYATFAFFCEKDYESIGNISQVAAVSCASVLHELGFEAQCKWPNDLLIHRRKVGGILCETLIRGNLLCVVVGIGINVNMPIDHLQEIGQPATSLIAECGKEVEVESVIDLLQERFRASLPIFIKEGFAPFFPAYAKLLIHRPLDRMRFYDRQILWEGDFHSLQPDGSIIIQLPTGEQKRFRSGELI